MEHDETTQESVKEQEKISRIVGVQETNGHAVAALVLGILSVVSPFQLFGLGGLVGVILGSIGLYQVSVSERSGKNSLAHSGKVLSIIGLVVSTLALIACIFMLINFSNMMGSLLTYRTYDYLPPRMTYFHRFWF